MTDNGNIQIARRYHQRTKHSPVSIRQEGHRLDWDNKPDPFKIYPDIDLLPLPGDLPMTQMPALQAVSMREVHVEDEIVPELAQIAHILYYTAGITKKMAFPNGEIYFRAAACAGALYPVEVYLVCGPLSGVEAGVYHFSPADFALRQLREGDFRGVLAQASGNEASVAHAPAVLVYTAITWRSSWKYRARSYRYHFWDCGTMLANCLATSAAQELPHSVVMGFVDQQVNHLVGVDGKKEKSLALFPLGWSDEETPAAREVPALQLNVKPLSQERLEYPLIDELHHGSQLTGPEQVQNWRAARSLEKRRPEPLETYALTSMRASNDRQKRIETVIAKRGSSRQFEQQAITSKELGTMLEAATRGFNADWRDPEDAFMNDLYINIHAVEGLPAGAYYYQPENGDLALLGEGDFRNHSAHLCLGQPLGGTSSATVFYIADLEALLDRYGNRGYRLAQMEAGIIGGKLYLAAYALERGATGLTFFDDEVTNFFLPENVRQEAIFVTALGEPGGPMQRRGKLVRMQPGEEVS